MANWLGDYKLDGPIRSGIEGAVHRARDGNGHRVAAKIILMTTPAVRDRCFEEVSMLRQCNHPNIVRLHSHVISARKNASAIILELCDMDYLDLINQRGAGTPECVLMTELKQLVRAVDYLHNLDLAHMDLKPENVLVSVDPETGTHVLKLTDFGFGVRRAGTYQTIQARGTVRYAAPEIYATLPYIRATPVDIYALGTIMFVATQHEVPYAEHADQDMAYVTRHVPISFPKIISIVFEKLIRDMMHVDPGQRPTTMDLRLRICA